MADWQPQQEILIFTEILSVNFVSFNSKLRQTCLIADLGGEDTLREIQRSLSAACLPRRGSVPKNIHKSGSAASENRQRIL